MRCRKVRSFLSAYCNGELRSRQRLAVSGHLAECKSCRREEALYRAMSISGKEIPSVGLPSDFNARLLNRVAQERFAETRSKAYLPKDAPVFGWSKLVPALASAAVIALVAIFAFSRGGLMPTGPEMADVSAGATDDSYLTVQPTDNPNLTANLNRDWSLSRQLATNERIRHISNSVSQTGFTETNRGGDFVLASSSGKPQAPYVSNFHRVRPVVRIYMTPEPSTVKEAPEVY